MRFPRSMKKSFCHSKAYPMLHTSVIFKLPISEINPFVFAQEPIKLQTSTVVINVWKQTCTDAVEDDGLRNMRMFVCV